MASYTFTPYSFALLIAGLAALLAASFAWRKRPAPGSLILTLLELAVAEWALVIALESAATQLADKILWSKVAYLGTVSTPLLYLLFALEYGQHNRWLTRRNTALLSAIPFVTLLLAFSNEWHRWIWPTVTLEPARNIAIYEHGPWFWLFAAYSYFCVIGGMLVLFWAVLRFPAYYRFQTILLILGAVLPLAGNVIYLSEVTPGLDWTPVSSVLSGILLVLGFFRWHLLELAPVARSHLIENMVDGVLVLDTYNRIADINPQALQLLNLAGPARNLIGQPASDILVLLPGVELSKEALSAPPIEIALVGGLPRYLELRQSPLYDPRSRFTGRLLTLRDITKRKLAEQEIERLRQETTDLIVHDLRSPINTILGAADMLGRVPPGEGGLATGELIEIITSSCTRMQHLVETLLEVSRMESGEAQMSLSEVSLPGLIQTVLNGISMLDRKSIDIRMDCDPALPPVIIDRVKIERVLINLLDNAIKHTPQKGWIAVHAEVIGESIQVSVTDTGPGIPPEERARIFERFAQVTAERRKRRGFGLGLTYCRLAIAAHDGRIWVEPGENARGSRFIFTLPLNLMP